ncbi:MAG: AAA family ATPase [Acidimicrobiaceae bacterium]|nr:AAA family ATPase [Acidimicrobiaceae bacterium]
MGASSRPGRSRDGGPVRGAVPRRCPLPAVRQPVGPRGEAPAGPACLEPGGGGTRPGLVAPGRRPTRRHPPGHVWLGQVRRHRVRGGRADRQVDTHGETPIDPPGGEVGAVAPSARRQQGPQRLRRGPGLGAPGAGGGRGRTPRRHRRSGRPPRRRPLGLRSRRPAGRSRGWLGRPCRVALLSRPGGPTMKIAVVGKGGAGKTTTSAVLARTLGRRGARVVALDCDTNPNLGLSLGVGDSETERLLTLREEVADGAADHAPTWEDILDRYGADAPDGVRLSVITRIENPEPG